MKIKYKKLFLCGTCLVLLFVYLYAKYNSNHMSLEKRIQKDIWKDRKIEITVSNIFSSCSIKDAIIYGFLYEVEGVEKCGYAVVNVKEEKETFQDAILCDQMMERVDHIFHQSVWSADGDRCYTIYLTMNPDVSKIVISQKGESDIAKVFTNIPDMYVFEHNMNWDEYEYEYTFYDKEGNQMQEH